VRRGYPAGPRRVENSWRFCWSGLVVGGVRDGVVVSSVRRPWRGVKSVAVPAGVAISTRVRTTPEDYQVLGLVAGHLGWLRRSDLAAVSHAQQVDLGLDVEGCRQARRTRLNARKRELTGQSSARWASAIIAGNGDQVRLARDAQYRHVLGLRAAITTIEASGRPNR
jgi:hypothetical protein